MVLQISTLKQHKIFYILSDVRMHIIISAALSITFHIHTMIISIINFYNCHKNNTMILILFFYISAYKML